VSLPSTAASHIALQSDCAADFSNAERILGNEMHSTTRRVNNRILVRISACIVYLLSLYGRNPPDD
jgi:hypothetical protein